MIKQLAVYAISFILLTFIGYNVHAKILANTLNSLPFSLYQAYVFHTVFSLLLCIGLLLLSKKRKYTDQLGFLYLVSVGLKIILFCVVFNEPIFGEKALTKSESVNLLIPMFLFLILEAIVIIKLLNKLTPIKNDK